MQQQSMCKVAVMGAGAVGSFYGAMLARAGHAVTLIGRPAHVQAIGATGCCWTWAAAVEAVRSDAGTEVSARAGRRRGAVLRQVRRHRSRGAGDGAAPGRPHAADEPAERRGQRRSAGAPCARAASCRRWSTWPWRWPGRAASRISAAATWPSARCPAAQARRWANGPRCRRVVDLFASARGAGAHRARRGGGTVGQAAGELRLQRDLRPGADALCTAGGHARHPRGAARRGAGGDRSRLRPRA